MQQGAGNVLRGKGHRSLHSRSLLELKNTTRATDRGLTVIEYGRELGFAVPETIILGIVPQIDETSKSRRGQAACIYSVSAGLSIIGNFMCNHYSPCRFQTRAFVGQLQINSCLLELNYTCEHILLAGM